jgi:hypothetical protein
MENYLINMTKTKPLEITSVKPDGETVVFGVEPATVEMVVETRGGLDDTALCWYSFDTGNLSGFYETGGSVHKNQFDQIMTGHYNIQIRCEDIVGDIAEKDIEFWAELDSAWPKISRVYRVGGNLIVKTDEDSSCAVSKEKCDFVFENGTMMNGAGKEHSLQISSSSVYYVQCRDAFGNHEGRCDLTLRTTGTTSNFNIHI